MSNIIVSRTIGENILLNKFVVKALPFYENPDSEALNIEHDDGFKLLRTMRRYPVGYDFSCNIIAQIKRAGKVHESIGEEYIDGEPYYVSWINMDHMREYLAQVSDRTTRQSLGRTLKTDLSTGFVVARCGEDKTGRYIEQIPPFRILKFKVYDNGVAFALMAWARVIFQTLIEDDCTKTGADGYITIPEKLYPLATQATKAAKALNKISAPLHKEKAPTHIIGSSNPIYKMEVFSRMKNTNNAKSIEVDRQELLEAIVPELIAKDGYLKISEAALHDILHEEVMDIYRKTEGLMLKNFYLGSKSWGKSSLYFDDKEAPKDKKETAPKSPQENTTEKDELKKFFDSVRF